jgi:hypothetical protein
MGRRGDKPGDSTLGKAIVVLLAFGLLTTIVIVFGRLTVGLIVRHAIARATFATTTGTIVSTWIEKSRNDDGGTSCRPCVTYRYTVDGREYAGNRFTYDTAFRGGAWKWAGRNSPPAMRPGCRFPARVIDTDTAVDAPVRRDAAGRRPSRR